MAVHGYSEGFEPLVGMTYQLIYKHEAPCHLGLHNYRFAVKVPLCGQSIYL
jgi:hypothetical protein